MQRTACTVFAHGARFTNHMIVSDSPIDWNVARWRKVLENYTIDGKPEFDLANAAERDRIDGIVKEYGPAGSMIEECPNLLLRTAGRDLVTDDNMGTEWRHYLNLE